MLGITGYNITIICYLYICLNKLLETFLTVKAQLVVKAYTILLIPSIIFTSS